MLQTDFSMITITNCTPLSLLCCFVGHLGIYCLMIKTFQNSKLPFFQPTI